MVTWAVPGPVGVHVKYPVRGSTVEPAGAPGSRLNVNWPAGRFGSVTCGLSLIMLPAFTEGPAMGSIWRGLRAELAETWAETVDELSAGLASVWPGGRETVAVFASAPAG